MNEHAYGREGVLLKKMAQNSGDLEPEWLKIGSIVETAYLQLSN